MDFKKLMLQMNQVPIDIQFLFVFFQLSHSRLLLYILYAFSKNEKDDVLKRKGKDVIFKRQLFKLLTKEQTKTIILCTRDGKNCKIFEYQAQFVLKRFIQSKWTAISRCVFVFVSM